MGRYFVKDGINKRQTLSESGDVLYGEKSI